MSGYKVSEKTKPNKSKVAQNHFERNIKQLNKDEEKLDTTKK